MEHAAPNRVLIFSLNYYPRFVGGAEVALKEITDRIAPSDIEFHMITLRFDSSLPRTERIGNVTVHRIGFSSAAPSIIDLRAFPLRLNKLLYQLLAAWTALALHRRRPFDAVWAMMAHACGIPAGIFKRLHPDVPYLLTLQEGDPPEAIERSMKAVWPLFRQGFARADALQAISAFLAAWGKRMGFRGAPVVIPNGADLARFSRAVPPEERAAARATLGAGEGDTLLVTASRLVRKNAVDDVIRALAFLPPQVSFIVCGIGPDEAALKSLANDLHVATRVRFLGEVGHEALPRILGACDIFVRPSRSEGMGNAFIEAFAAGIPVIATQTGGIKDFLFDAGRDPEKEPTGFAVDADAPRQIAAAVEAVLADPERARFVAGNAKKLAAERYDWDGIALRMRSLIQGLCSPRSDARSENPGTP